jgi:hypothetical protein
LFFGGINGDNSRVQRLDNLKASLLANLTDEEIAQRMFIDDIKQLRK